MWLAASFNKAAIDEWLREMQKNGLVGIAPGHPV